MLDKDNEYDERGLSELHLLDILIIALDMNLKTDDIVTLLKLMRNEITAKRLPDANA